MLCFSLIAPNLYENYGFQWRELKRTTPAAALVGFMKVTRDVSIKVENFLFVHLNEFTSSFGDGFKSLV